MDTEGRFWRRRAPPSGASQLVVPGWERQDMFRRFTFCRPFRCFPNSLPSTGPGLLAGVASLCLFLPDIIYGLSGPEVSLPAKGPHGTCRCRPPMGSGGYGYVGHVTTTKGNRYVLAMVDCFSRWTAACPLPDKTALVMADALFQHVVCRFGMPSVIHSDQGRE